MRKVNFALTAVTIQNDRVRPAFGRLNPELNSPPSINTYTDFTLYY